jgi:hypothetical protein
LHRKHKRNIIVFAVMRFFRIPIIPFIILSAFRCEKESETSMVYFNFVVPLQVKPNGSQINLGDTLWLSANFPDTVLEFNSKNHYKLENFPFPTRIGLFRLTSVQKYLSEQPSAVEKFAIKNFVGSANNFNDTFGDFNLQYSSNTYRAKIALVPKTKGVFSIFFMGPAQGSVNLTFISLPPLNGVKRKPVQHEFFYSINSGETNHDLFVQNCASVLPNLSNDLTIYAEKMGTFTFEVK